jgi:hypothetical protein
MIQTLSRNWWLVALCGVLNASIAVLYFVMGDSQGPLTFHTWRGTVLLLGRLALAAGVFAIAAGVWRAAQGVCWPLVINGLALSALGLLYSGVFGNRISFQTIALLVVAMAMSMGVLELVTAGSLGREWFLRLIGVGALGFAVVFLAFVFRWIKLNPGSPTESLVWLGAYFGFSAICLLGLAARVHGVASGQRTGASGQPGTGANNARLRPSGEAVPPLGNPKHAH